MRITLTLFAMLALAACGGEQEAPATTAEETPDAGSPVAVEAAGEDADARMSAISRQRSAT